MHLSSNHVFYSASSDVAEIAKPLNQLGINYFTYMRSYHDGSRLYLYHDPKILTAYLEEEYYLIGNTECKPERYKEQVALWSTVPNQKVISECARSRGVDHGMFMFQPQDDYCEVFSFATQSGNEHIVNTYLSKMDVLTTFKQYFREKAAPIIDQAVKQKIILPFNNKIDIDSYLVNPDTINNKLMLLASPVKSLLTNRQLQCCLLLMQGKTAKEIANTIGLSARTVEDYLSQIRTKLGCRNKTELIIKLSAILNVNSYESHD